jgi:PEP-CTERM motif
MLAPFIALNGASMVSFTSITGVIDLGCAGGCAGGPDGQWLGSTSNLQSYNGISGMFIDRRAPLYGVFVGAGEPADPAPERLHFEANQAFASLSPLLHQTFFIGDGLTGTGTGSAQQFVVPGGATRLFLGIVDGLETGGQPGGYFNNTGEFVVTLSAVPEPASGALLLAGVATLGFLVRRRG